MKNRTLLTLLLLCFVSNYSFGQEEDNERVKKRPGLRRFFTGYRAPEADSPVKTDRLMLDLHWNSWLGDQNNTKTKWYSVGFNVALMTDIPFSKRSPVGIGIGLGFSHFNVHNSGSFFVDSIPNDKPVTVLREVNGPNRKVNKFTANYIEVPFEFRFRFGKKVPFKFSPGFKVGVMTNLYNKYKLEDGNRYKEFNFPDENRLRYGVTARIGVGMFMLYGSYFFSDLFKHDGSSKLKPFTLGISLSLF